MCLINQRKLDSFTSPCALFILTCLFEIFFFKTNCFLNPLLDLFKSEVQDENKMKNVDSSELH